MSFTFLHIPHTGGRVLKNFLRSSNIIHNTVHNAKDIKNRKYEDKLYFILRPTVDRVIAQCIHYSKNLKRIGIVNHMDMDILKLKDYNPDNPYDFIELPENKNVYCKFLLGRTDFSLPITDNDFEKVLNLFQIPNFIIWDLYSYPLNVYNLENLIGFSIKCKIFRQTLEDEHKLYASDVLFVDKIKELNIYDITLFDAINVLN